DFRDIMAVVWNGSIWPIPPFETFQTVELRLLEISLLQT
ncbi:hypothetical protein NPIL_676081, partial [Nephila pilipes]